MKRFSNILLFVDEGTNYSAAMKRAATLAKKNQSRLTACTVMDAVPDDILMAITAVTPAELHDITISEKRRWLDEAIESVASDGVSIDTKVLIGKPFVEIIRQVLGNEHDLIIKTAAVAGSLKDRLFGSTDMHLMRKCPCPVWIVKPSETDKYRRILAAVDRSQGEAVTDALNRQILEMSTSLALIEYGEAHVVHAWELIGEEFFRSRRSGLSEAEIDAMMKDEASARQRWLNDLVRTYGSKTDEQATDIPEPQRHVIKGCAENVVPELARELAADLVVMGTVARTGIDGFFMGNTAESILTQLDCSVLTVKPPGFTSPVTLGK